MTDLVEQVAVILAGGERNWSMLGDRLREWYRVKARAVIPVVREDCAKVAISVREKAITARNFLAISEPIHADRHLRDLIKLCEDFAPDAIASHDAALREGRG